MPPFGTDSYMYHLYFPAEWIQRGALERISIIGLFPEYYPVFGELLYGFLLLPLAENAAFASPLQWGALVMACSCMVFLAQELGYSRGQTFFKIILPQMVKRVIPSVTNETITLVKDTSLASAIAVVEIFTRAKQIVVAPNSPGMLTFAVTAVFYTHVYRTIISKLPPDGGEEPL